MKKYSQLADEQRYQIEALLKAEILDHYTRLGTGVNENTNGLIRQNFTKGSRFVDITHEQIEEVMLKFNYRPRKALNYKTPHVGVESANTKPLLTANWIIFLLRLIWRDTVYDFVFIKNTTGRNIRY